MSSRPKRITAVAANARIAATAAEKQRLDVEEKERRAALTAAFGDEENSLPNSQGSVVSIDLLPLPPMPHPPSCMVSLQLSTS